MSKSGTIHTDGSFHKITDVIDGTDIEKVFETGSLQDDDILPDIRMKELYVYLNEKTPIDDISFIGSYIDFSDLEKLHFFNFSKISFKHTRIGLLLHDIPSLEEININVPTIDNIEIRGCPNIKSFNIKANRCDSIYVDAYIYYNILKPTYEELIEGNEDLRVFY